MTRTYHAGRKAAVWYCDPDDRDPLGCLKVKLPGTTPCRLCCGWTADPTKWTADEWRRSVGLGAS